MTIIKTVRSIPGAEEALAVLGLSHDPKGPYPWTWAMGASYPTGLSDDEACTVILGVYMGLVDAADMDELPNLLPHKWSDGTYTSRAGAGYSHPEERGFGRYDSLVEFVLSRIAAHAKEKKNAR